MKIQNTHILRYKLINKIIRIHSGYYGFFDENGNYQLISEKDFENFPNVSNPFGGPFGIDFTLINHIVNGLSNIKNTVILNKSICQLKPGDTIDDLLYLTQNTHRQKHSLPSGLDRFVTKIGSPSFQRFPENQNPKTFDLIYIELCLISENSWDNWRDYFNANKKLIISLALKRIANNKQFKKYGIPINFLKISRATLRKDCTLELVFELKNL